jgi:hypothetical protein
MFVSEAQRIAAGLRRNATQRPNHIVIGITHPQTCLTLTGRLRALREAGFRVTLIASPGKLLDDRTAARGSGGDRTAHASAGLRRSPIWCRWCGCGGSAAAQAGSGRVQHPQGRSSGQLASWLAGIPARVYMLRGLKLETSKGIKRAAAAGCGAGSGKACAQVVLCNSQSMRSGSGCAGRGAGGQNAPARRRQQQRRGRGAVLAGTKRRANPAEYSPRPLRWLDSLAA